LDQPVGECGFAVVDMGDDGEIADLVRVCGHAAWLARNAAPAKWLCWRGGWSQNPLTISSTHD
jgi:hypothetical protein